MDEEEQQGGGQKFKRGDVVHIKAELPSYMSHFTADKDVVILGSYKDKFGGTNVNNYSVLFFDGCETSWYETNTLDFVREGNEELIKEIQTKREIENKLHSGLQWVVDNWKDIRDSPPQASATALMALVGITNPFGEHGEYWDYYQHWRLVFKLLDPVLLTGDIKKVEEFIAKVEKVEGGFLISNDLYDGNSIKRDIPQSWKIPYK